MCGASAGKEHCAELCTAHSARRRKEKMGSHKPRRTYDNWGERSETPHGRYIWDFSYIWASEASPQFPHSRGAGAGPAGPACAGPIIVSQATPTRYVWVWLHLLVYYLLRVPLVRAGAIIICFRRPCCHSNGGTVCQPPTYHGGPPN